MCGRTSQSVTESMIVQIMTGFELDKRPRETEFIENYELLSKEGDNLEY